MGCWSRDVVKLSRDSVFWSMLAICRKCHELTESIMANCHKFSLRREKSLDELGHARGLFFQLSIGLAHKLAASFASHLAEETNWRPLLIGVAHEELDGMNQLIAHLTLKHAAEYDRRIHRKIRELPFTLLTMLQTPKNIECEVRRGLARRVLDATPEAAVEPSPGCRKCFLVPLHTLLFPFSSFLFPPSSFLLPLSSFLLSCPEVFLCSFILSWRGCLRAWHRQIRLLARLLESCGSSSGMIFRQRRTPGSWAILSGAS